MKLNGTTILALLVIIVGGAAYWLVNRSSESEDSKYPDRQFAVENTDDIGKIVLGDYKGNVLSISRRNGNQWIVNDSFPVNERRMETLLRTLEDIEIKYIPSQAESKTANKQMATYTRHAKIYNTENELIRSYFIGGTNADGTGTYMKMEGHNTIFTMHIAYMRGAVDLRYDADKEYWLAKEIFPFMSIDDLAEIKVEFPHQPRNSFSMNLKEKTFQPTYPLDNLKDKQVVEAKMRAFAERLLELRASRLLDTESSFLEEDMSSRKPEAIVTIDGQKYTFYQRIRRNQLGEVVEGNPHLYSPRQRIESYFVVSKYDFYHSVNRLKLDKIFKKLEYFYDPVE